MRETRDFLLIRGLNKEVSMAYSVRRMKIGDLNSVIEIEKSSFSQPWSKDGFEEALAMDENCFLVCEDGDKILGYAGYYGILGEAEVTNVAVAPEYRNAGIGRVIMDELLRVARVERIERIVLEVRMSNAPAIHLYESIGFAKIGVRKGFYDFPKEDAFIMEHNIV